MTTPGFNEPQASLMKKFDDLMREANATDQERIACAFRLARLRAERTVRELVDMRKVTAEQLLQHVTI